MKKEENDTDMLQEKTRQVKKLSFMFHFKYAEVGSEETLILIESEPQ